MRITAVSLACALLALLAPHRDARAGGFLVFGDSVSVGGDDEPTPDDRCPPGGAGASSHVVGWPSIVECRLRARSDERPWFRHAQGAATSWWGVSQLARAIAAAPGATTTLLSFHVNDCSIACGAVCAGGSRSGLACTADADCPSATCSYAQAHPCSSAETRANLRTIIDGLLAAGHERVVFWKSPGRIGGLEGGSPCGLAQFDGSPDAIDTLFRVDPQPIGYADDPRVEYVEETFRAFCPGSGLQGCDPGDGAGDRRRWWFSHDDADGSGGNMRHIHPNAWGYMEIAARLGERLTGEPLDRPPPRPLVLLAGRGPTSLEVRVLQLADPDGDALQVYAWAACADTRGTSPDPACDRPASASDPGPFLPRECGAIAGSDHDATGASAANPPWNVRHSVLVSAGRARLEGLAPDTEYRICAAAWDGFQGSLANDAIVARTLEPDTDADGVPDARDVCLEDPDPEQLDSDRDGYGNACDADYNGDGLVGTADYIALRLAFAATTGDPRYELRMDAEGDGVIGGPELGLIGRSFGAAPGPSGLGCAGVPPCDAPPP